MPKKRVVILGGGMAGVAAAWELTHRPPDGIDYEITVYDASFRLGGKCASGRNVAMDDRIEEHGIHILMGFYSQVLRILRDGYRELDPALGYPDFAHALEPGDLLQLPELVGAAWTFWTIDFPKNGKHPGDADPDRRDLLAALTAVRTLLAQWMGEYERLSPSAPRHAATLQDTAPAPGASRAHLRTSLYAAHPVLVEFLRRPPPHAELAASTTLRHLWMAIWFAATNLVGIIEGGLFSPDKFLDPKLNAKNYKAWLEGIGGAFPSPAMTWDSPIVNAIYDLVFSHDVGFAAGAALYDTLLMLLDYAGHVYYRMASMGDVVFGPLYFALKAKGVRFFFEHVVSDVEVSPPGPDGRRQVQCIRLTGDGRERTTEELFVHADGRWWWPTASLVHRPVGPIVLGPGDFDLVVSAIPIGAMQESAPSLAALPPIADAVRHLVTVPTQAVQIWFDQTFSEMGWNGGRMMLGSFARPLNSAGDMSQCLPFEHVPGAKSVLYLCDVYTGDVRDPDAAGRVRREAIAWADSSLRSLLPAFTWDRVVDPAGGSGSARFAWQYARANVSGTEQYVACAPGTVIYRPAANGAGVTNLLLASDWVLTEENAGCVEGAARSGVQAARALLATVARQAVHLPVPVGPPYVQNDDDWVFPAPVVLRGAGSEAFVFLADARALDALCARFSIGGATLRPWSQELPLVVLAASASADIRSGDPRYTEWGSLSERELAVFVPVTVSQGGASFTALLCPYLFVDESAALVAGREIFGLPKELATFPAWPFGGPVPMPLSVEGLVLEHRGASATRGTILSLAPLLGVAEHEAAPVVRGRLEDLWRELQSDGPAAPVVALKQFHAVEDGTSACYQALIRFGMAPSGVTLSWVPGVWRLSLPARFFPNPSASLGLADGAVSFVSFRASLDFTLTLGQVVAQ
jgi:uncharacterized protein with NAD-binding domain and iron-sulfur cluster